MDVKCLSGEGQFQPFIARTQTIHRPIDPVAFDCAHTSAETRVWSRGWRGQVEPLAT